MWAKMVFWLAGAICRIGVSNGRMHYVEAFSNAGSRLGTRAKLLKAMLSGDFEELDFEFEIDGEYFNKLWFLTDGIYPGLSRFVKTSFVRFFATLGAELEGTLSIGSVLCWHWLLVLWWS